MVYGMKALKNTVIKLWVLQGKEFWPGKQPTASQEGFNEQVGVAVTP